MSYALVVAEVRRGLFEERNLDTLGLANLMGKETVLLVPEGTGPASGRLARTILTARLDERDFLNPMTMTALVREVIARRGQPEAILFTSSSSGFELAPYLAGCLDLPIVTDASGFDAAKGVLLKSYYSDKIFAEFKPRQGAFVATVRSGSFREHATEGPDDPETGVVEGVAPAGGRSFVDYVEEEKGAVDITKADFLLSVGRGIGNKDEIADYEELAGLLRAVLSGSRPVIDKMWLPKPRQVGTSGKTVHPKVYLAMAISGAFQHVAGMKDSACIIAGNKDTEAPIFQYAHYGIIGDANKVRDKLKDMLKE
jgi:electron transfer flavoprotein alpha subunit